MPAITVTKDQLLGLNPCDPASRVALFARRKTVSAKQAFAAGVSISDVLWVLARLGRKDLCVEFALQCAQRAVKFDKSGTAQPCIDATRTFVVEPSESNQGALISARRAAADTSKASYAANAAAYAAADAADASKASYAANAAVYATNAAAYAADAAYAAVPLRREEKLEQQKILIKLTGGR